MKRRMSRSLSDGWADGMPKAPARQARVPRWANPALAFLVLMLLPTLLAESSLPMLRTMLSGTSTKTAMRISKMYTWQIHEASLSTPSTETSRSPISTMV